VSVYAVKSILKKVTVVIIYFAGDGTGGESVFGGQFPGL
jgi:hypothetical protein